MYTISDSTAAKMLGLRRDVDDEIARQRAIVRARLYHSGRQYVRLTDRLREFLGDTPDGRDSDYLRLNVVRIVVQAVLERLTVQAWSSSSDAMREWVTTLIDNSSADSLYDEVFEAALRDGEAFLIVDWNAQSNTPRLVMHPRYTDYGLDDLLGTSMQEDDTDGIGNSPSDYITGMGYGCVAHYPNDDYSLPPTQITKRWWETYEVILPSGKVEELRRQRLTIYKPGVVEKYELARGQRAPIKDDPSEPWPLPVVSSDGTPIMLAHHVTNAGLACEAWDAIPLQNAINKQLIDLLQSSDVSAFRVYFGSGWTATRDGQPYNGSNALTLNPGEIISTPNANATFSVLDGAQPAPLLDTIDKLIYYTALVTDTPVARFTQTGQVARAETIKAQEGPLVAKVKRRQGIFGGQLIATVRAAIRLQQLYAPMAGLDPEADLTIEWGLAETPDEMALLETLALKREKLGIPLQQVWREYGYTDEEITRMLAEKSAEQPVINTATAAGNTPVDEEEDEEDDD